MTMEFSLKCFFLLPDVSRLLSGDAEGAPRPRRLPHDMLENGGDVPALLHVTLINFSPPYAS